MSSGLREVLSFVCIAAPAIYAYWVGRRLTRRLDDPVFPELQMSFHQRVGAVLGACLALGVIVSPHAAIGKITLGLVGAAAGLFTLRRAVFKEQRGMLSYLVFNVRFWVGAMGVWILLAVIPGVTMTVAEAETAGWHALAAAVGLGVLAFLWTQFSAEIFAVLVRARPLRDADLAGRFESVLQRATCPRLRVLQADAPGGHWVNAFALPSHWHPGVLLSRGLLDALTPEETTAIFAHEVAHLEHFSQRRLVIRDVLLVILVAILLALLFGFGLESLAARAVQVGWPLLCLFALLFVASRNQAHEHQSDLRAVELVGDPEIVITALTKIHALMRLPRRWSPRGAKHQSHPSLARRIRAIRDASGHGTPAGAAATAASIMVRSADEPGTAVVLGPDRLHWLRGVPAEGTLNPAIPWAESAEARTIRYSELGDLRIEVGRGDVRRLVAVDALGKELRLALHPHDVTAVKERLPQVELELHSMSRDSEARQVTQAAFARKNRFWASVAMLTGILPPLSLPFMLGALLILIRPSRATLAAAGAIALATALLGLRSPESFLFGGQVLVLPVALKVGLGFLFLLEARRAGQQRLPDASSMQLVTITALAALGLLYALRAASRFASPLPIMEFHLWARHDAGLALVLAGLAAAMLTLRRKRAARVPALVLLAVAALIIAGGSRWFRSHFADHPLAGPVQTVPLRNAELQAVRTRAIAGYVSDLRLSPSGKRFAAAMGSEEHYQRFAPGERPLFRIEADDELWSVAAWDVQFMDDDLVAILRVTKDGLVLQATNLALGPWVIHEIPLPQLASPTLRIDPVQRRWDVVSTDYSRSVTTLITGQFGQQDYEQHRWTFEEPDELILDDLKVGAGPHALVIASRFDFAEFDVFPVYLSPLASYWTLSELGTLRGSLRERLALTTLHVWCAEPLANQATYVCAGTERESRTRIWTVDPAARSINPVGELGGYYHTGKLVANDELLLHAYGSAPVVVNLTNADATALTLPRVEDASAPEAAGVMGSDWMLDLLFGAVPEHVFHQAMTKRGGAVALASQDGDSSLVSVYRVR